MNAHLDFTYDPVVYKGRPQFVDAVDNTYDIGDNNAQFIDMQTSSTDLIDFNLFGVPMVGPDVCGFNGDTTLELCARWMAVDDFFRFRGRPSWRRRAPRRRACTETA